MWNIQLFENCSYLFFFLLTLLIELASKTKNATLIVHFDLFSNLSFYFNDTKTQIMHTVLDIDRCFLVTLAQIARLS